MRSTSLLLAFLLLVPGLCGCARVYSNPSATTAAVASAPRKKVDFATQIKPMLESRCQPCHFSGGVMYQRLPFDRPETIKTLGTKMFTRIKDEKERQLLRDFFAE